MDQAMLQDLVASGGPFPDEYSLLDRMLNHLSDLPAEEMVTAVQSLRSILSPTLTRDTMQGFAFLKPHGYSGDFEIIDRIYQHWTSSQTYLKRWDHYFHYQAAPTAVRNRKDYFIDVVRRFGGSSRSVLNVASGPGRDLFECLQMIDTEHTFTCLDIDPSALAYSKALCAPFAKRIKFHQGNPLRFRTSDQYDLVWSGGLFDYFTDRVFIATLKRLLRLVVSGGECVLGNFSMTNPSRPYMQLVGDWNLTHRTPESLIALATSAGVEPHLIDVREESLGVNLFLHIKKE